jgi:hypothetical protein
MSLASDSSAKLRMTDPANILARQIVESRIRHDQARRWYGWDDIEDLRD